MTGSRGGDTNAVGRSVMRRPRWLAPLSLLLVVGGLGVSAYMTYEHFTENATLVCTIGGVVDCAKVTTSSWAYFLGIPVAVLGLVFFVVALLLVLPGTWRRSEPWVDRARLAWLSIGLAMVLYLVWAEIFQIGAICSWCTVVHVITFVLWAAVMFGQILSEPAGDTTGLELEDVERGA